MRDGSALTPVGLCFLFSVMLFGCSSVDQNEQENRRAWIDRIALVNLHFRRPQGASADPHAGPGGEDYQSKPLPDSRIDCEPSGKLFAGLKLDAIRACLSGPNLSDQDFILTYSVQKSIQPALKLRKEEPVKKGKPHRPACVDELLAEIPVPREIYFQGIRDTQKGELGCFAAGLTPEASPLIGFRLMPEKTELTVKIPPLRALKTNSDVQLLLLSWALGPFWNTQRNQMEARVVPDHLCQLCIGEKNMIPRNVHESVPAVPLWPAD
ncbi:MAG: hypothetical protein ACJ763_17030 [Bdellovibrionia bacterium]